MEEKPELKLTKGSKYKIYSLGSREHMLESQGVFEGYVAIGLDEVGMILKLDESSGENTNKTRIVPLHTILAIDVIDAKPHDTTDDDHEIPHYVG